MKAINDLRCYHFVPKSTFIENLHHHIPHNFRSYTAVQLPQIFNNSIVVLSVPKIRQQYITLARANSSEQHEYQQMLIPLIQQHEETIRPHSTPNLTSQSDSISRTSTNSYRSSQPNTACDNSDSLQIADIDLNEKISRLQRKFRITSEDMDAANQSELVQLVKICIASGRLIPSMFLWYYFHDTFRNLLRKATTSFRFSLPFKVFAAEIHDLIKGSGYDRLLHQTSDENGNTFDVEDVGMCFPSRQTLDAFRVRPVCQYGPIIQVFEICQQFVELGQLDNCWIVQIDGVSLSTGLQPDKNKGICHGLSGKIHPISQCQPNGAISKILRVSDLNPDHVFSKHGLSPLITHASGAVSLICGTHCDSSEQAGVEVLLRQILRQTQKFGLKILWICCDGSNIELVDKIAKEFSTYAMSCNLHLAGTIRNSLLRGSLAVPVKTKPIFDGSRLKSIKIHELGSSNFNSLQLNITTIRDASSIAILSSGRPLLAMKKITDGSVSWETPPSRDGFVSGGSFNEQNRQFKFSFVGNTRLESLEISLVGDMEGSLVLGTVHIFSMNLLRHLFYTDRQFQQLTKWQHLYCTDRQSETQILGVSSPAVFEYLDRHSEYLGLVKFLKDVYSKIIWPIYHRNGFEDDPRGAMCKLYDTFSQISDTVTQWDTFFSPLRRPNGGGTQYCITKEALNSIKINTNTFNEISQLIKSTPELFKGDSNLNKGIDPHLAMNSAMEGTFGEFRALRYKFNSQQFLQVVASIQRDRLYALHPDKVHQNRGNRDTRRYMAYEALETLRLSKEAFEKLRPIFNSLQQHTPPLSFTESEWDTMSQLANHCRSLIIRGNSLRNSYYKFDWGQQLM